MTTFYRSLSDTLASPAVFPDRCVGCGRPKEAESRLLLKRLVTRGRQGKQQTVTWESAIPHCQRCARTTQTVFLAGCVPFVVGLLGVGLLVMALVTAGALRLGLDEVGQPNNANALIVGAFAGLLAGVAGGFVAELAARLVLLPFLGPALLRAPLLTAQLLSDSDYVAGLSGKLSPDGSRVTLAFTQPEIAREFGTLNAGVWTRPA